MGDPLVDAWENYSPESVRKFMTKVDQILVNQTKQRAVLGEFVQALVSHVVEKTWFKAGMSNPVCTRCGERLGLNGGDYVYEFDGKRWHAGNCVPEEGQ